MPSKARRRKRRRQGTSGNRRRTDDASDEETSSGGDLGSRADENAISAGARSNQRCFGRFSRGLGMLRLELRRVMMDRIERPLECMLTDCLVPPTAHGVDSIDRTVINLRYMWL